MRFEFVFEKLLSHKRALEDVARRDWSEAQAKVDAALKELDGLYKQVEDSRARAGQLAMQGGPHGAQLIQIDGFINGQKIRIEAQRSRIRELMSEAERLQEALVEAAKERKTLEKLKERRYEEYRKARKKQELKRMDDMVIMRFKKTAGDGNG